MSSLLGHCHGEKTHFSRNEKERFVQPDMQWQACLKIAPRLPDELFRETRKELTDKAKS